MRIRFFSKKGVEAYEAVCKAGEKESRLNRAITKRAFSDEIVSTSPFIVKISVKIPWLVAAIDLEKQVISALEKQGAKNDKDFVILEDGKYE